VNSEEIFDFSAEQMTQQKTNSLKNQMCGEFSEIFQLCKEVLDRAQKPSLIKATLQTLLRFLNWIPLGFIFETDLIETLTNRVRRHASLTKTMYLQMLTFLSPLVL
jgi:exportin-1